MKRRIKSIAVNNSPFFQDGFSIEFSDELNCLMGGRGTGKSTLLYFIQSALGETLDESNPIDSVLRANLHNGTITLTIEGANGKEFTVTKTVGIESLISQGEGGANISARDFSNYFTCDIYPALAIEEIGKNPEERLELIDKPIQHQVAEIKSQFKSLQISLEQNAEMIRSENARLSQRNAELKNFTTAKADLKSWRENRSEDLTSDEQVAIEKADEDEKIRNSEKRYVKNIIRRFEEIQSAINEVDDDISRTLKLNDAVDTFTNRRVLARIATEVTTTLAAVTKNNEQSRSLLNSAISKIEEISKPLEEVYQGQQAASIKLKQKLDKHREYITRYDQLSKRVEELGLLKDDINEIEARRKKSLSARQSLLSELNEKKKELFSLRKATVDRLNAELGGHVRITLTFGGITQEYETRLRNALKGSNIRYNTIIPYIVENFTPDRFAAAIHSKDVNELKKVNEIDAERSTALIGALHESKEIYRIESLYVEDLPEFFLKVEDRASKDSSTKEHFKKSDELSTGQRCTAVLPIVFAVSDNPLIIDQPEDNLDNEFINSTVREIVQEQKKRRQLIFITHNPNVPVVSNAEFNVFLHYANKRSMVEASGTVENVKGHILSLLEGGREAFDKRKELYESDET